MRRKNNFRFVTVAAIVLSSVLWMIAGALAVALGSLYVFVIIGFLALLASLIAINSARLEGSA